ncbi:hypothetical protein [Staphylococcus sp. GDX8P107P-1]|uniref:hypothetical protein n=1 Tax=Staphylococcus sp. GDX8P107P-1 TaxID=2804109 RepID=UPI001AEBDCB8|nr:hypothetical protein [Staphylococcus sp. GDX8P107P-1]
MTSTLVPQLCLLHLLVDLEESKLNLRPHAGQNEGGMFITYSSLAIIFHHPLSQ